MRPICINHGCNEPVTYSHKDAEGNPRWRIHCSHCQAASYGKWSHRSGVTPFKTGKCANHDGHLKFSCPTNFDLIPIDAKGMTEVDHKDGDYSNHNVENLEELCVVCHKLKGQRNGDYNNQKNVPNRSYKGKATKAANDAFNRLLEKTSNA
jgi:5-methylcytosine-specific restriction endonuclease McrA